MKNFFKSENERNLWIKLNAERILYEKKKNALVFYDFNNTSYENNGLGNIDEAYSPMWVSKNQLDWDENRSDNLRFSFEELLSLTDEQLYNLNIKRQKTTKKLFGFEKDLEQI